MITMSHIEQAAAIIKPHMLRSPLLHSTTLSRMFDAQVYLKLENLQKTGSFKIRGAVNKLIQDHNSGVLSPKGVVAASAGNHAQGVAVAAGILNLPATIIMPRGASIAKQEAVRSYGGRILLHGDTIDEGLEKARELAADGLSMIHPFDDPRIIAGQGTIGLEIVADLPDVDIVVVPVGGGGLIAGIALAVKANLPSTRVIGVQAAACPSIRDSLEAGERMSVKAAASIADGISVKKPGKLPFAMIQRWVDEVVVVAESHIAAAILLLLERKKMLTEGAGAAGVAAMLNGAIKPGKNQKMVLVVSGGNMDSSLLGRIVHQGLVNNGRIARIRVRMPDHPGALAGLLHQVAALEANVLDIHHDRNAGRGPIYEARVELNLETRSMDHIREILKALAETGYDALVPG